MSANVRPAHRILFLLGTLSILLSSCGGGGGSGRYVAENRSNRGYNPGVGPFDSRGNYVERWADDKSKGRKWRRATASGIQPDTAIADVTPPMPRGVALNTTPAQEPDTAPATPTRPTPPVASVNRPTPTVKVKPKRKAPIRHTIKKGDTLWALSRKYGTTVTAIQRANGLKGTNLKIGRRLLIPRY